MEPLLHQAGIRSVEDAMRAETGDVVAQSRSTSVRRVPAGAGHVYVKVLSYPTLKDVFLRMASRRLFWHRARREWQCIHLQRDLGLRAANPVCFGELRRRGVLRAAVLVTEEIPGARRLDTWIREHRGPKAEAAAAYVARLHTSGFHHGDLNARNVLVTTDATGAPTLWNVDSGRGRRCRWRGRIAPEHVRDLAPIALAFRAIAGDPAMERFVSAYATAAGVTLGKPVVRMLEAEMLILEPRELRRLGIGP